MSSGSNYYAGVRYQLTRKSYLAHETRFDRIQPLEAKTYSQVWRLNQFNKRIFRVSVSKVMNYLTDDLDSNRRHLVASIIVVNRLFSDTIFSKIYLDALKPFCDICFVAFVFTAHQVCAFPFVPHSSEVLAFESPRPHGTSVPWFCFLAHFLSALRQRHDNIQCNSLTRLLAQVFSFLSSKGLGQSRYKSQIGETFGVALRISYTDVFLQVPDY